MPSSKVWRKGRWFWYCITENNSSCWTDHWACGAQSKLTYTTREEALKAGQAHERRTGHEVEVTQIRGKYKKVKCLKK